MRTFTAVWSEDRRTGTGEWIATDDESNIVVVIDDDAIDDRNNKDHVANLIADVLFFEHGLRGSQIEFDREFIHLIYED